MIMRKQRRGCATDHRHADDLAVGVDSISQAVHCSAPCIAHHVEVVCSRAGKPGAAELLLDGGGGCSDARSRHHEGATHQQVGLQPRCLPRAEGNQSCL